MSLTSQRPRVNHITFPVLLWFDPISLHFAFYFFFQAEDCIRDTSVTGVQTCALPILRAQVTGQLNEVHFREGDSVKKGDRLFSIDPRPFEAQVAQADANLKRDVALLSQAEARSEERRVGKECR